MEQNYALLASIVGVVLILVRTLEALVLFIIKKLANGKEEEQKRQDEETRELIRQLHSSHECFDKDGKYIWYFPSSVVENQETNASQIQELSFTQRDMLRCLEKAVDVLERVERRQISSESQMCSQDCSARISPKISK